MNMQKDVIKPYGLAQPINRRTVIPEWCSSNQTLRAAEIGNGLRDLLRNR